MQITLILHNLLRWAIVLLGAWTVLKAISGISSGKSYTSGDNKASLFFMISCDLQLLAGLVLYFGNGWFGRLKDHGAEVMKNAPERFFAMEHALMMIIAWLLVHVGRSAVKKSATDAQKHRKTLLFFGIALLLILAMAPWPFRQAGIARSLFPQF